MLRVPQSPIRSRTPSNRSKYDSYTPRKRYMKEQVEYGEYYGPSREQVGEPMPRGNPTRRTPTYEPSQVTFYPKAASLPRQTCEFELDEPLGDCSMLNCATSTRKPRLRQHAESKEVRKRLEFEEMENKDWSNQARPRL